jgi:hypothetical protein
MNQTIPQIEKWEVCELSWQGPVEGNPFMEISLRAEFWNQDSKVTVDGFYDGEGIFKVRFMPSEEGIWQYVVRSNIKDFDGITGSINVTPPKKGNHGPVRVSNTYHFAYMDGTPHRSFGTTCYAWIHQEEELQELTLKTLGDSPFNKIRMCVFPKYYDYNKREPELFPFEKKETEEWDFTRFQPYFFRHLERRINDLKKLGIEADIILFHPYDHWGFSDMGKDNDDRYLRYVIARLAAFRNVWWSLANEYDYVNTKTLEDWERFGQIISEKDPYGHLTSIHNGPKLYDHTRPWITHCSIQRMDLYKTSENVNDWRDQFQKPVVVDECEYEGNINHGWGNITGQELVRRYWEGVLRGGYMGHGETYVHPDDILWWSHGGQMHGSSPERIAFLRNLLEEGTSKGLTPIPYAWDAVCGGVEGEFYLLYFGVHQPAFRDMNLPEGGSYHIDVIDTWDMTITPIEGVHEREVKVILPGKPYMAIRMERVKSV